MDYIIKFVGIIMIVSAMQPGDQYRALLPLTGQTNISCANLTLGTNVKAPKHEAYVRVSTDDLLPATQWPAGDVVECVPASQKCRLFRIANPSDLKIESGIDSGNEVHESASYCLVPQLRKEFPSAANVASVNENATIARLVMPGGDLTAEVVKSGAIYSSLHVPARPGTVLQPIVVLAIERATKAVRSVVVKAGSTIMLVNATADMAVAPLDATDADAGHPEHAHFTVYNKLLSNGVEVCKNPAMPRPCNADFSGGVTGEIGCSNTGCCKP